MNKIITYAGSILLWLQIMQCQNHAGANKSNPGLDAFRASLVREPATENADGTVTSGAYITDEDIALHTDEQIEKYYWEHIAPLGANADLNQHLLIVNVQNGMDDKWTATEKKQLTYCVSDKFFAHKATVVNAMNLATRAWEAAADVDFTYHPEYDKSCDPRNAAVTFDVRPVSRAGYYARSFFPSNTRRERSVLIDATSFSVTAPLTLAGILRHELGHTLGFRHEHTRPQAGSKCFEDNHWRSLTTYDAASVMHYPQCNGSGDWGLNLTPRDKRGAKSLYGAPLASALIAIGTPTTVNPSGALNAGEQAYFGPFRMSAHSRFSVSLQNTQGDSDLHVRYGAQPTTINYDCRPYLGATAIETCETVSDIDQDVYILVSGYTSSAFNLSIQYTTP